MLLKSESCLDLGLYALKCFNEGLSGVRYREGLWGYIKIAYPFSMSLMLG